jgi:hypothetical protein
VRTGVGWGTGEGSWGGEECVWGVWMGMQKSGWGRE